jgi:osmoprotectant transport system ATP-binding protein
MSSSPVDLPESDGEPVVSWLDVKVAYAGGTVALDGVTLDVRAGECLALLGTSGSGKTTLLKTVNRLIEPTGGAVRVRGRATSDWDPIALRRSMGYVIQDVGLMPHLDLESNVGLPLKIRGAPQAERRERARVLLELVGLPPADYAHRRPAELSGGQRQRVGVARALATDPSLILMDEPFGALDRLTREELQREFAALRTRLQKTVVLVTHDLVEAERLADRIALLHEGRLLQCGSAAELRHSPQSERVRRFFAREDAGAGE